MEQIDYACGIDCPDGADDEQMLMDYIIRDDCELCYLDTYLKETFRNKHTNAANEQYVRIHRLGLGYLFAGSCWEVATRRGSPENRTDIRQAGRRNAGCTAPS